ncbi:unnamed protein product [Calicophoron daubneyi]|uniref:Uncharacterized protein n=1 Tax=Calicophoron daubneyi TaxID=300641 RepID=A0AAV2TF27_CALDB
MIHAGANEENLTGGKLGLAATMFAYVVVACSFPLILATYMQKYQRTSSTELLTEEGSTRSRHGKCYRCLHWTPEMRKKVMSRANCFAAGALMAVGFLDVFMDTLESVQDGMKAISMKTSFPVGSFLTLLGFFLVLGAEQVSMRFVLHPETKNSLHSNSARERGSEGDSDGMNQVTLWEESGSAEAAEPNTRTLPTVDTRHGTHEHNTLPLTSIGKRNWIRVIILLFAISLHSIFEGIALGLTETMSSLLTLFAAVSMHKLIIAISIGINLAVETNENTESGEVIPRSIGQKICQSVGILAFAGASPLGVLIGYAVTSQGESKEFVVAKAILQGLACGTLIYVVFCELLPQELEEKEGDRLGKFLFLILGFALISIVIGFSPAEE